MLRPATFDHAFVDAIDPVWPEGVYYVRQVLDHGLLTYAYAFEDDDGPAFAMGLVPYWKGVGAVWMLFDKRSPRFAFFIVRRSRALLEMLERDHGYRRIQGEWHVDCPSGTLARMMGFQIEGILRNYGPNGEGDYVMAARTS